MCLLRSLIPTPSPEASSHDGAKGTSKRPPEAGSDISRGRRKAHAARLVASACGPATREQARRSSTLRGSRRSSPSACCPMGHTRKHTATRLCAPDEVEQHGRSERADSSYRLPLPSQPLQLGEVKLLESPYICTTKSAEALLPTTASDHTRPTILGPRVCQCWGFWGSSAPSWGCRRWSKTFRASAEVPTKCSVIETSAQPRPPQQLLGGWLFGWGGLVAGWPSDQTAAWLCGCEAMSARRWERNVQSHAIAGLYLCPSADPPRTLREGCERLRPSKPHRCMSRQEPHGTQ